MSILSGVGLEFREGMSGPLGVGATDPREGAEQGRRDGTTLRFDVEARIADLAAFLRVSGREAELAGTVTCEPLGGTFPIRDGVFHLFTLDPSTGMRRMHYRFRFTAADDQTYFLHGHKEIRDDRKALDVVEDMTRVFMVVYRGENDQAPVYGAGELCFKLSDAPSLVASMRVVGEASLWQRVAARLAFVSFAYGALRDEYLKELRLVYDTRYENLALSGTVATADGPRPFFLVSGEHEKGFPWGDGETFWDVLLAVGDGNGGYQRYCVTDRVLEGLKLDIEQGSFRYRGPLFHIQDGYAASFSEMRGGSARLEACEADLQVEFEAEPHETVPFPFPVLGRLARKLSAPVLAALRDALPSEQPLGMHITPHGVTVRSGTLTIREPGGPTELAIDAGRSFGEAERATFRNLKQPTLLYGYLCGLRPARRAARVQIHTRTLRDAREHWAKDRLDAFLGAILARVASAEMRVEDGRLSVEKIARGEGERLFARVGAPVVEVNNDHYPTAVFQRRIVRVRDPSSEECLALEEDMDLMRLEAINSNRTTTVASIRDDQSKFAALDRALDETGFGALAEKHLADSGKARADFSIVIKPNFMFAYNKHDHTTYTDPELVGHLAKRLRAAGFQRIAVAEAQSTYGEYFEHRSVREVADYLGFDGKAGYEIIDLTEDAVDSQHLGPHLGSHPVPRAWREADFRISFAKNKTHSYAYFTLTLKNIYGALALANKFKEYHCNRDIYHTTIEYLTAFPVHFGLVDAYLSADGPFGIFADTRPNETHTIIAGPDLVAVDWVGATKMGIDPMISRYLQLAVEAFGKPAIRLIGDPNPYRPWLNVPEALTLFTHKGLDASYHFGNLFYTGCAQMDESRFRHKSRALHIRALRRLTVPLRRTFFVRTGENPTWANRLASWALYKLGF
jgi:uncharacterized protein (DUF362 family)